MWHIEKCKDQPDTMPAPSVAAVTANPEIVSIPEVITMLDNPTSVSEVAKKYGYKQVNGYEIYHFDKFSKLFTRIVALQKSSQKVNMKTIQSL